MSLNINNLFFTVQGEGLHSGRSALFVRMPYCNLACPWCDTEFNTHTSWTEERFRTFAISERTRFAVITGGEPMMNKHTPKVIEILKELGYYIACETNGNFPILEGIDFVTCSPKSDSEKKFGEPYYVHPDAFDKVSEFKYVVDEGFNFSVLNRHSINDGRRYSLSPEFNKMDQSLIKIQEYIKDNPGWRISLQTHKFMKIP